MPLQHSSIPHAHRALKQLQFDMLIERMCYTFIINSPSQFLFLYTVNAIGTNTCITGVSTVYLRCIVDNSCINCWNTTMLIAALFSIVDEKHFPNVILCNHSSCNTHLVCVLSILYFYCNVITIACSLYLLTKSPRRWSPYFSCHNIHC
jgi:hypothetical protein